MSANPSIDPEYEYLQKTVACVREFTREFDGITNELRTARAELAVLSEELGRLDSRSKANRGSAGPSAADTGAFHDSNQSLARRKALGDKIVGAAVAFAQELNRWAEVLEKRELQMAALSSYSSTPVLTGRNGVLMPDERHASLDPDCSQDNSGGNPAILIYTNDSEIYKRYTTTQRNYGQLANANVTYIGSPDSSNNAFLATNNPLNVYPSFNDISYNYRVTINQGESWYFYRAQDAQFKQEAMAFNAISAATVPRLTGFSAAAGESEEVAAAAVKRADADIPSPVDAAIPWGKGIRNQGMTWEDFSAAQLPVGTRLPPGFETFDFFNRDNGVATSTTTLNTMTPARLAKPNQIFSALAKKIDDAAEFTRAELNDFVLDSKQIKLKILRVAVPLTITEEQLKQMNAAIQYGREREVIVIIMQSK